MMTKLLTTEKEFLRTNHEKLAKQYPGQFLLIKDKAVHGAFPTYEQGVSEAARLFGVGPCLVRSVQQPHDLPPLDIPALSLGIPLTAQSSDARS